MSLIENAELRESIPALCIYHFPCVDGFTAAWVVERAYNERQEMLDTVPCDYGQSVPIREGQHVIIVDFSFPRDEINLMRKTAGSMIILDHHKTAFEALHNLPEDEDLCPVEVMFDMTRSGCGITWDYYFGPAARPAILNHIEDRDLWRFALDGTKEIHAVLTSYPFDFEQWDWLMAQCPTDLIIQGEGFLRKQDKEIRDLIAMGVEEFAIDDLVIPIINCPKTWGSEAAHILAELHNGIGAYYFDVKKTRHYGLRSIGDIDVSTIAKRYGGGGHKNAAGFKMPIPGAFVLNME